MNGERVQKATPGLVDSHLPRFSQGLLALLVVAAFLVDLRWAVPVLAAILAIAVVGGPRTNPFAYLYRVLPIPRGEPEPAAPPRFAQTVGAVFLAVGTMGLFVFRENTSPWWVLGWGPALAVALLAALAAATAF
ncbi:MAG: DUF4395 domain-containing protein [Actinomycetota bacterium]|nr:DUF4395 domain-containing protein [Actinomycetota bacterium]